MHIKEKVQAIGFGKQVEMNLRKFIYKIVRINL